MSLSRHTVLHKSSGMDSPSGGLGIRINRNILSSKIELDTSLQAVAVSARTSFGKTVTVCNFCLRPSVPIRGADFYHRFEQLPHPFIVLGNCNRHKPLCWNGCCDSRGRLFEEHFNDVHLRI